VSWPPERFRRPCWCRIACSTPLWLLSHRSGGGLGIQESQQRQPRLATNRADPATVGTNHPTDRTNASR